MAIPASATQFIEGVLKGIGAPINGATVQAFTNWLADEQGGPNLPSFEGNRGNPLGVMDAAGHAGGASGNVEDGIKATVANLLGGNYNNLVAAFRRGTNSVEIDQQVVASPWNGNRYGGQAQFDATAGGTPPPAGGAAPTPLGNTGAAPTPTGAAAVAPNYETQGMKTEYTGPGAYKGYDLSGVPGPLRGQAEAAINALAATPGLETKMLKDIFTEFPQDAWMTSITEDNTDII